MLDGRTQFALFSRHASAVTLLLFEDGEATQPAAELNDRFPRRRAPLLARRRGAADLATRLAGSADLYQDNGRRPFHSVNFITSHDGFTLNDLVSYAAKHNHANGEHNRDGSDYNLSANYGAEGPSGDPGVQAMRLRQSKNLLATLFLSLGTPLLLGGDELARTQHGNNNAYCHDSRDAGGGVRAVAGGTLHLW